MEVAVVELVTIRKASQLIGYSEDAIRSKINGGIWLENTVWKWGPDGVILIILEGYNKWAKSAGKASRRGHRHSASSSSIMESDTGKP